MVLGNFTSFRQKSKTSVLQSKTANKLLLEHERGAHFDQTIKNAFAFLGFQKTKVF